MGRLIVLAGAALLGFGFYTMLNEKPPEIPPAKKVDDVPPAKKVDDVPPAKQEDPGAAAAGLPS